jgi:putative NADH-flavin reductase
MRILIFGASGRAGKYLVKEALERGHVVVAFTRNAATFPLGHPKLQVARGDILDFDSVIAAVKGIHGVLSALGTKNIKRTTALSQGTANIIRAMNEQRIRRLVCLTCAGLFKNDGGFLSGRVIFPILLGHVMADKRRQAGLLEASGLDWALVRSARFSDGPATGRYEVTFGRPAGSRIALGDLAEFMVTELESGAYFGRMPIVSSH